MKNKKYYRCKSFSYAHFEYCEVYEATPELEELVTHYPHDWELVIVDKEVAHCPTSNINPFADHVYEITSRVAELLIDKNRKYGNSALEPVRVFSKSDAVEQIKVRIDDKLSRMVSGQSDDDEDVVDDLIGYLILLKIAKSESKETKGARV